jgi:hypothetical protein
MAVDEGDPMKRIYAGAAALVLTACTSTTGKTISEERLATMKGDRASVQEVIAQLGQPTSTYLMPTGERILTFSQSSVYMDPKAAIPIVGLFANNSGYSTNSVSLNFDKDGRLTSYSTQDMNFGGGTKFQAGN